MYFQSYMHSAKTYLTPKTSVECDRRILLIPVDRDGVSTFKNHFFHTTNSLVPLLSLLIYPQTWRPRFCFVPLIYGLGYLAMAGALQAYGGFCTLIRKSDSNAFPKLANSFQTI